MNACERHVGERVEAGEGEDYDRGIILEIEGDKAFIGWDTGVRTWTPVDDLRTDSKIGI